MEMIYGIFKCISGSRSALMEVMASILTLQANYLPADAFQLITETADHHPIVAALVVLMLFAAVLSLLKRRFGRGGRDIVAVTLFFVILILFSGACLYLLINHPGYR